MAKATGPLLSFDARGKFGECFAFSEWKGLHIVKTKPVPFNPQSTAQTAERVRYTTCYGRYRQYPIDANDKEAWRRYQDLFRLNGSEYNCYMGQCIKAQKAGNLWANLHEGYAYKYSAGSWKARIKGLSPSKYADFRYGLSPTAMNSSAINYRYSGYYLTQAITGVVGVTYFYQYHRSGVDLSGIYTYTHY